MKIFGLHIVTDRAIAAINSRIEYGNEMVEHYKNASLNTSKSLAAEVASHTKTAKDLVDAREQHKLELDARDNEINALVSQKTQLTRDLDEARRQLDLGQKQYATSERRRLFFGTVITKARKLIDELDATLTDRFEGGRKDPKTIKIQTDRVNGALKTLADALRAEPEDAGVAADTLLVDPKLSKPSKTSNLRT